jgi:non-homologous end joining protein Ku
MQKKNLLMDGLIISRREHVMMLEAFDMGLLATTLRYPYEVRDQAAYFEDISADMKELAAHIVDSKTSHFDPSTFVDRYETALVELLRAKQAGRVIEAPREEPAPTASSISWMRYGRVLAARQRRSPPRQARKPESVPAGPLRGKQDAEAEERTGRNVA